MVGISLSLSSASLPPFKHSELQCVPDIWALVEWSDWLTPRNLHVRRRYDTVFYLCFSETQPAVCGDGEEIVDATVRECVCGYLVGIMLSVWLYN